MRRFATIALIATTLGGCGATPLVKPDETIHRIATSRNAPDPIYYRIRTAHLPEVIPAKSAASAPRIMPIIELVLENDSLCDGALALANATRYQSYCSSVIGERKITLHRLGTVDELAEAIAKEAQIKVVVDHEHGEIRFLTDLGS